MLDVGVHVSPWTGGGWARWSRVCGHCGLAMSCTSCLHDHLLSSRLRPFWGLRCEREAGFGGLVSGQAWWFGAS